MNELLLRFNYVVFFNSADFYRIPYHDLFNYPGVKPFFGFQPDNIPLAKLFQVHTSKKVNSIIRLPFKSLWMNRFRRFDFGNDKPLCFIFMATFLAYDYVRSFVRFLHINYPQAFFVCYYSDIIKDEKITPKNLSDLFDYFISYDVDEAKKYNMHYHPTSFSDITVIDDCSINQSDVYFLGAPKDRLSKIYKIYDQLCDADLNCSFFLYGVPKNQRRTGITFINKRMPYYKNLQHVIKSRCLLELEQGGASGATLRTWESINFGKGLITDNYSLSHTRFYNPKYISYVSRDYLVDIDFVKKYRVDVNPIKNLLRPAQLLSYIDKLLIP